MAREILTLSRQPCRLQTALSLATQMLFVGTNPATVKGFMPTFNCGGFATG